MKPVQAQDFKGHVFYPGADQVNPYAEGLYFYMVSYTWQDGPYSNRSGAQSTHGLMAPADKTQYGRLVNDVLDFVRSNGMGAPGYQVVTFFDIKPHGEYRDPLVVAEERAKADAERTDQLRKELTT
ncbi:hypothetical protein SEA_KEANU_97 [Streptomyces phage Keanu]|nr:hypothetical protein SEA_KEANU_97 [Streptomyces phage Keanu]